MMPVIQKGVEAVFHSFQSSPRGAAFSFPGMLQHRCDTSPEFFPGVVAGMKKNVFSVFHIHDLKVFPEPGAVASPEPVFPFRNTGDPRLIVPPGQFNRSAELCSLQKQDSVHATCVIGSDQLNFHGYGVPDTLTICRALWEPFFIS